MLKYRQLPFKRAYYNDLIILVWIRNISNSCKVVQLYKTIHSSGSIKLIQYIL